MRGSPFPARVMDGKVTKNHTDPHQEYLIPGERFQCPEQAGKIILASNAMPLLGEKLIERAGGPPLGYWTLG